MKIFLTSTYRSNSGDVLFPVASAPYQEAINRQKEPRSFYPKANTRVDKRAAL
jgi:hypothetical protein